MYHLQDKPIPEHDQELINKARSQRWEEIDEDAAETEDARTILHDIIIHKYHREEYRFGVI